MKNKLNCILLIDDDETVNFLHKYIIDSEKVVQTLLMAETGEEALQLLGRAKGEKPDIIFLDLNMPKMDGWEFLDQYKKMESSDRMPIIVILSSSANPDDKKRAEKTEEVNGFYNKPLTPEMLREIVVRYF